jgi:hypothetical protein
MFWLFWTIDLLLAAVIVLAGLFRDGLGANTDNNVIFGLVLLFVLIGSLLVRYTFRLPQWSVLIAALPLLILVGMYYWEKWSKK